MKINKELENAVLLGDIIKVRELIKKGCDLDSKDKFGRTIISDAIVKGFDDIVKVLCEAKANINVKDKDGRTPLHFAAIHSKLEIAKILVAFGAIIDSQDENGNTPLSNSVFYSHGVPDIILFLKEKGANPNLKNNYDITPKELAESIANYDLSYLFQ
jgi:ankyrin repeat protein